MTPTTSGYDDSSASDAAALGLQASFPFLHCESYPAALRRIATEAESLRSATPSLFEYRSPLALLREAQQAFHVAYESRWGGLPIDECWIVQESHAGQRRPILTSYNGAPALYKPRSLHIETGWQSVLNWYEGALGECISQKFEVVNSGNTGWCEVVEPVQITTLTEVGQYYRRLGLLAAITWALGSSDLTGSNVVAAGAAPTVVDAEMILVPGNCVFEEDTGSEFRRLGLMPFTAQDADGVSVSFGAAALRGPACKHARFDLRREFTCALCHHVPRLDDRPCYVDDHAAAMCEGFSHGLCILRNSAPQLAAQGSPLDAIKGVAGRVTMRPSAVYDLLKRKMSSNWRKAEEISSIEILLRKLPTKHPVSREQGGKLVAEELRNLVQGDLPRFEMPVSDRALRIGGAPVVQFKHSALERARERLRGLTAARVDHAAKIFTAQVTGAIASSSLIVWRASR